MSKPSYLAFDFGAESGRAILGTLDGGKIHLEEIHRFRNRQVKLLGHLYWDVLYLFDELKTGLIKSVKSGHQDLRGIGVDTWGVDFGLVDKNNQLLGNPFCYRDSRTEGMMEEAFQLMNREEIYSYTGIQFMQLNSIYQLFSMVKTQNEWLDIAENILFMPDLINFLLTGEKVSEYTIASTSQLLNAEKRTWEPTIFKNLGLPIEKMSPIIQPGTVIGPLLDEVSSETDMAQMDVIAPCCHDTASAVVAVPAMSSHAAYLSSGTWSLLGIEADEPIINKTSLRNNFTNEGGFNGKIRFLRNTMGLWLLQRCVDRWEKEDKEYGYNEITRWALDEPPFQSVVNPDDHRFLNPPDMQAAIVDFCKKSDQPAPQSVGEFARCIFESLAFKYRYIIEKINSMLHQDIEVLHIVGGGSQNRVLNQFTANATGLEVIAGPVEATALGNIIVQSIATGACHSLDEGHEWIRRSFPLKTYTPTHEERWDTMYEKVKWMFSD